jgi:hypothetical protein
MKVWTTLEDVRERIRREWQKGLLPVAAWSHSGVDFPYRIGLKGPTSRELSEHFDDARAWIALWKDQPVEWREFVHPLLGRNKVPVALVWNDLSELLVFIGKKAETERFITLADQIVNRFSELESWIVKNPHAVLEQSQDWPRLLNVLAWLKEHPRPGIYLRQIDVEDVHTKFLEAHRGLLSELLDLVLPPEAVDFQLRGVAQFAERYGFLTKPVLVRFRRLEPSVPKEQTWRLSDWARWTPLPQRVLITENEINFLALPDWPDTLAVFGSGYGFDGWEKIEWLQKVKVYYWGDLDTHGFAILDQLRSRVPAVSSLMMDRDTLLAHKNLWGHEPQPTDRTLTRLNEAELEVYHGLQSGRWAPQLRLEQEKIGYAWICRCLKEFVNSS